MAGERSFASLGARAIDLEAAWTDRRADAEHLMAVGRYPTAITMGLYALEILLKVRICRILGLGRLPKPFEIHDLEGLLILSGLSTALNKRQARAVKTNWTKIIRSFAVNHHEVRYLSNKCKSQQETEDFFSFLNDTANGVIPWILRQT